MADGIWKGGYSPIFGHSMQLSLNKFFDPSTPSKREGGNEGKNVGEKRKD